MRNKIHYLLLLLAGIISSTQTFAQENLATESAMRSNGKIYVVLAICITILLGFFIYLVSIDRKIKKIEDKQ
jgi:uncharacterized membrane protein